MKGLLGIGRQSGDAESADWNPENPEKAQEVGPKITEAALEKGKQGVMSMPEVTSKEGIGKEDAAVILYRRAEKKFEVVSEDIREVQDALDREMTRLEKETEEAIKKERQTGKRKEIEGQAEQVLEREEQDFKRNKEGGIEEDIEEIQEYTEVAETLFKVSEQLTDRGNRKKSIKRYLERIKDIERYKIAADLQIEEEDVEELLSDLERILDTENIRGKEPEALAEEVKKAIKQYSRDKRPVDSLDFIDTS
jgi:hypothetical protein